MEREESLTVIVNSSYIPSHPSSIIIRTAFASLDFLNLPEGTEVILMQDAMRKGLFSSAHHRRYEQYLREMEQFAGNQENFRLIQLRVWGHINRALRKAASLVKTEYVLVIQHDFEFMRGIDIREIISMMRANPDVKHLRFNKNSVTVVDWDAEAEFRNEIKNRRGFVEGSIRPGLNGERVPVVRTLAWSDNNYVTTVGYLKNTVFRITGRWRVPPEHVLNPLGTESNHAILGTFIYGMIDDPPAIRHLDGRQTMETRESPAGHIREPFAHNVSKHIVDFWIRKVGRIRMFFLRKFSDEKNDS